MIYQNHVIDPTFFWDAIEEFSFNYKLYVNIGKEVDSAGRRVLKYELQTVRGSLQSNGSNITQSKTGNTNNKSYEFYCKSLYRININDVLEYKNNFYICKGVKDYDEYGVRSASLEMIQLTQYRDLAAYIKYLEGEQLV